MKRTRNCNSAAMSTGISKCPVDMTRIKGALIVERGKALPADLDAAKLEQLCHDDRPERVYPLFTFVEFARNGGEVQTGNTGYGPTGVTGLSARTDTFTMAKADLGLASSLMKCMQHYFDAYFVDDKNNIYGYDGGDGKLKGIQMAAIYSDNPVFSSGTDKTTMTVSFCYEDVQDAMENMNFMPADFNVSGSAYGLTPVVLCEVKSGKYAIIEEKGGYDRTEEFGEALADGAGTTIVGATSVEYADGVLSITASGDSQPALAKPSVLYAAGVKGVEYVRTESLS